MTRIVSISYMLTPGRYAMFLFANIGTPEVWSPEEVQVYLARFRAELDNRKNHGYQIIRRVWAQKPLEEQSQPATEA